MKVVVVLICLLCSFSVISVYAGYDEDIADIYKGMPKSVKLFIQRQIDCNHWSGEEPYDKARLKEINSAVAELKCDTLDKDKNNLIKKYKAKQGVIDAINKAEKEFY